MYRRIIADRLFENNSALRVAKYVKATRVASLSDIAAHAGINASSAKKILGVFVLQGEVEVISPVSSCEHDPDLEYYRILRHADKDCRWETGLEQKVEECLSSIETTHKELM